MDTTSLKQLLDTCYVARHIVETLPELPKGMKPRQIHVLDAIHQVLAQQGICRVSDVSSQMNITMPSITKLIQELEAFGMVEKYADPVDKRVSLLRLTGDGRECVKRYVLDFHRDWAKALDGITREQVEETIKTIGHLRDTMPVRKDRDSDGKDR